MSDNSVFGGCRVQFFFESNDTGLSFPHSVYTSQLVQISASVPRVKISKYPEIFALFCSLYYYNAGYG